MPRFSPIFLLLVFILIILLVGGVYYWRLVKTQSYLGPMVAAERIELFLSPGAENVGYFVPGQTFFLSGEKKGGFVQVTDEYRIDFLWIVENSSYEPLPE